LRSPKERAIQSIAYEVGRLCLATPLYAVFGGGNAGEAFGLMLALAVAVMIWSPWRNTVFDGADFRLTGRQVSGRPDGMRIVHAISHEVTNAGRDRADPEAPWGHGVLGGGAGRSGA
jgi:uncharacterized membrane protein